MTISELQELIINSTAQEIEDFVNDNSYDVRLVLSNLKVSPINTKILIQCLEQINKFGNERLRHQAYQILYVGFAFYFKEANRPAYVGTCHNKIDDSILKQRLLAWYQYKTYTNPSSHINKFPRYMERLSNAISDGQEEYYDEILIDLHNYFTSFSHVPGFNDLFFNPDLQEKYPILKEFVSKKKALEYKPEIVIDTEKIYSPTPFSEDLFNRKFLNYIRYHEDTVWTDVLLGYHRDTVRLKIINLGQGHFDDKYENLSPDQIVKLYCYFNMRMHYYSSLYLFEKCTWLKRFIKQPGSIKFIDIGCGPATSAIAFIDLLRSLGMEVANFDYIAVDYYNSMLDGAAEMLDNDYYKPINSNIYINELKQLDLTFLDDASCVIINTSYLFASDTLKEDELAESVLSILKIANKCPKFLFFQNVVDPEKNRKYEQFKTILHKPELIIEENRIIKYNNYRHSTFKPSIQKVRFEVIKF